jgi:hypothetical protein
MVRPVGAWRLNLVPFPLTRISHTASAASCRLRRPAGCSASRLSPLRSGCCGPPPLRSGPNFPWTVCSHTVRREPPGGKSGPRVDARGTLRATLRVVCLRLTSLCSVYLRYAPIRSGCGHGSSLRLATKRYEKSGLRPSIESEFQGTKIPRDKIPRDRLPRQITCPLKFPTDNLSLEIQSIPPMTAFLFPRSERGRPRIDRRMGTEESDSPAPILLPFLHFALRTEQDSKGQVTPTDNLYLEILRRRRVVGRTLPRASLQSRGPPLPHLLRRPRSPRRAQRIQRFASRLASPLAASRGGAAMKNREDVALTNARRISPDPS